jgi:hypothetical protein
MAALLTVAQMRGHVETDLADEALQRLIDDADEEIIDFAGEFDEQEDCTRNAELSTVLFLSRRAGTVSTVVEQVGDDETTLAVDDYRLRNGGTQIERLGTGTNPRTTWGEIVTVTYVPVDRTVRRTRVEIDLVKLAVQYNALTSEGVGDYSSTAKEYEDERARILARLAEGLAFA